jgi:hypothetical protein
MDNAARSVSVEQAFLHSLERAQGADLAGSAEWVEKQDERARDLALRAAGLAEARPGLRDRLADALGESRRRRASPGALRELREGVRDDGLPRWFSRGLGAGGATEAQLGRLQRTFANGRPPKRPFTLAGLLRDRSLDRADRMSAAAFRSFASRVTAFYGG